MLKHIFIFFILFFAFPLNHYASDTIPPTGKLTNPKHLSVISGNTVKISVEAEDEESGIKEVRFYAFYTEYSIIDTINRYGWKKTIIGKVSKAPYEIVWNCSDIPDQDIYSLSLWCDIEDNAGNINSGTVGRDTWVVIDRNRENSKALFPCKRMKKEIVFDGKLDEWKEQDSISFQNGNNNIVCYSAWDKENLYLAMNVYDNTIYSMGFSTVDHFIKIFKKTESITPNNFRKFYSNPKTN